VTLRNRIDDERSKGGGCLLAQSRARLPEDERTAFDELIGAKVGGEYEFSARRAVAILAESGVKVGTTLVLTHRRGECRCSR
jgi:hypothetical protein